MADIVTRFETAFADWLGAGRRPPNGNGRFNPAGGQPMQAKGPIRPMTPRDALPVARLHRDGIATGFLSSLGETFLRQLYAALPGCPAGFGYVCVNGDNAVQGFIVCAEDTGQVYKQTMVSRGAAMAVTLLPRVARHPSVIRHLWETLRYPSEAGAHLPPAEILSIVVCKEARGQSIGRRLVRAAIEEFRRRGIEHIKVAAGAENEAPNAFYRKCGFRRALQRLHHGQTMNVYVRDTSSEPPRPAVL